MCVRNLVSLFLQATLHCFCAMAWITVKSEGTSISWTVKRYIWLLPPVPFSSLIVTPSSWHQGYGSDQWSYLDNCFQGSCISHYGNGLKSSMIFYCKKGKPSARGSRMSGVWGRDKPRQAFPPQNLRRGCFEPTTWWLSETALTTAPGLPFHDILLQFSFLFT